MATVTPTITRQIADGDGSIISAIWVLTTADTTGVAISMPEWIDRTWHIKGTQGSSVMDIQTAGSDTDADFVGVRGSAGGLAASYLTALPGVVKTDECSLFMRPKLTTAGTGASVTVTLIARRVTGLRQ